MSLQTRLEALVAAVGADVHALYSRVTHAVPFTKNGALVVVTGTVRFPISYPCTIESVRAMLGTAPTGSSAILDIKKNGTTIYGTSANRPTFAVSATSATVGAHSVTTLVAGDYLTVDVVQIGSTVAGSDLAVSVVLQRTG